MNDLPNITVNARTIIFADDTTITASHNNFETLKHSINLNLEATKQWMLANRLTINTNKTEAILITNRQCTSDNSDIKINDTSIPFSNNCKYLGTTIDTKLNFSMHIQNIISKISRNTGILYRIKKALPLETRLKFYYSMIYPYLSYNILIWGGAPKSYLNSLKKSS